MVNKYRIKETITNAQLDNIGICLDYIPFLRSQKLIKKKEFSTGYWLCETEEKYIAGGIIELNKMTIDIPKNYLELWN